MASYLVLTPPGTREDPMTIRFVRDGFSLAALVVPVFWMLYHRMWLFAIGLIAVEAAVGVAIEMTGATGAGTLVALSLALLIALESGQIRAWHLISKGWSVTEIVVADSIDTAEEIYFSNHAATFEPDMPAPAFIPGPRTALASAPALGLFDYGKGR